MTEDAEEAMRVYTGSSTDANANPTVEFLPTLHDAAHPQLEVVLCFPDLGPSIPTQGMQEFLVLPWFFLRFAGLFCCSCEALVPPGFGVCTPSADFAHG